MKSHALFAVFSAAIFISDARAQSRADYGYPWPLWSSTKRADILSRMKEMFEIEWSPANTFRNYAYTNNGKRIAVGYNAKFVYRGMPYSQTYPQMGLLQFRSFLPLAAGDLSGLFQGLGNDCSGAVSIAWAVNERCSTEAFDAPDERWTTKVTADALWLSLASLKPGDALVRRDFDENGTRHIRLVESVDVENATIDCLEQTANKSYDSQHIIGSNRLGRIRYNFRSTLMAHYKAIERGDIVEDVVDDCGDNREEATTINLNNTFFGNIEEKKDKDFFRFELSRAKTVTIYTEGHTDTNGRLLDKDGKIIKKDSDSGRGTNFKITQKLKKGIFYIQVKEEGEDSVGPYELHLK